VTGTGFALKLHPDRLLPAEPGPRAVARRLYGAVRDLPVISPHGHVDPRLLLDDEAFCDPAALFVTPDHYLTRLLHADGLSLDDLGVGRGRLPEGEARQVWRHLCARWHVFAGTPVAGWLEAELSEIFGVTLRPAGATADAIFDQVWACLAGDAFRPRALYRRFRISVLATTPDPCDDLTVHAALAADASWEGRVIPTFRPDALLEPARAGWAAAVERLGAVSGIDTRDYAGYLRALEERRRFFAAHGATSADHSHADASTDPLGEADASASIGRAWRGW
jgi:glucuronate isomerase